jgi:glycosyltransferase involved in cell wall biosynthesis
VNICLISQEYPPDTNWGGIATYTQVLARQLAKTGNSVHVVTLAEGEEYTTDDQGVLVHRVSRTPKTSFDPAALDELGGLNHGLLYFSQCVYDKVQEIHEKDPIDVIEAPETCAQALLTFKRMDGMVKITRLHTPFFWVRHLNNMPETPDHLVRDQLEKLQTELSTAVTSPTHAMADVVRNQWGTDKIEVIPNFFNLKAYAPELSVYEQHLKGLDYILFFGRLEYRKGVHVLAQALPAILERHREIKAVFVGSDSDYNAKSMKAYIMDQLTGYEDRVEFIGNIPHAALYPIIERAKFVLLPSLWENFPYACIEAMSLGKTVVACNSGGFPEIIENEKEGLLCPPGDVAALKQTIFDCLERHDIAALGKNARDKVQQFDTEKITLEMVGFYKSIVPEPSLTGCGKPLKIGYILQHFPFTSETFVINEIIALQALDAQIHPVSLFPPEKCQDALMSKVENETFDLSKVNRQQLAEKSPFYSRAKQLAAKYELPNWYAEFAACVADYAIENKLTLLHAHFATESALTTMLTAELTEIPFSFTAHAYDIFIANTGAPGETLDNRLKLLVQRAARVITISEFNKRHILQKTGEEFSDKIEVIHCGIDPERFTPVERSHSDSFTLLCVGRFVEKKGHEFLLKAFGKVASKLAGARLKLIGEGPLKPGMMDLCRELGLEEKIDFLGNLPSESVWEEMKLADVFVLHSITAANGDMEGIPVSLMEASASGLPVISSYHSGIPELVVDGLTGFLTNEKDVDALARCITDAAASPQKRAELGLNGSRLVEEKFKQSSEAVKLSEVFGQMITSSYPLVSIIVPVYNGQDTLELCLDSISKLCYPKDLLEVILVDNGSTDSTVAIAKRYNVTVLHEPSIKSSYAARNVGIKAAKGDLLAFTDADCIVTPNWLKHLVAHWNDTSIGCFAGEIEAYLPEDLIEVFSDRQGILRQSGTLTCAYLPYTQTANSAYRKTVFNQVGLFISEMTSGGDADIAWRMQKQLGLEIKFIPEALVYHKHRTSLQGLFTQFKKYEHGKVSWSKHIPDYQLPTVEQRKMELENCIERVKANIDPDVDKFANCEIDLAGVLTPFFNLIMALGTYKARLDDENIHLPRSKMPQITQTSESASNDPKWISSEQKLIQFERELLRKDALIKEYELQLASSNRRIQDLLGSLSWRITAPLRKFFDFFLLRKGN